LEKHKGRSVCGNEAFHNRIERSAFGTDDWLFSIETDGSLYRISPSNGTWSQLGKAGEWANTIAVATMNGQIYTIETNGALYKTNPSSGSWSQIGKAEFGKTRYLFAAAGSLYTIENGGLYRVDPSTGTWVAIG
jgi:hypothetical protein